jgi:hypothetical protein
MDHFDYNLIKVPNDKLVFGYFQKKSKLVKYFYVIRHVF